MKITFVYYPVTLHPKKSFYYIFGCTRRPFVRYFFNSDRFLVTDCLVSEYFILYTVKILIFFLNKRERFCVFNYFVCVFLIFLFFIYRQKLIIEFNKMGKITGEYFCSNFFITYKHKLKYIIFIRRIMEMEN